MRRVALASVLLAAPLIATSFAGCVSDDENPPSLDLEAGSVDVGTADRAVTPPSEAGAEAAVADAAEDATEDAALDAPSESSVIDASEDAADDGPADAGADVAPIVDSGVEAAVEAGFDAGVDAAPDAGPHTFVYVGGPLGGISGFDWNGTTKTLTAIDTDGEQSGTQFTMSAPAGLALAGHPNQKFLYGCATHGVSTFSIDANGALTHVDVDQGTAGVQDVVLSSTATPRFVAMHPSGKMLYASDETNGLLYAYDVNAATGALTFHASYTIGTGPRGIAVSAAGDLLAVVNNGGANNTISMFKVDANGVPTPVDADPDAGGQQDFAGGPNSVSLVFNPAGTRLFLVNSGGPSVTPYTVNGATGAITKLTAATTSSPAPLTAAVHPNGNLLFASGYSNSVIDSFTIASDGSLSNRATTTNVSNPRAVAFDPTGAFLFASSDNGIVYVFGVDGTSGALTNYVTTSATNASGGYTIVFVSR